MDDSADLLRRHGFRVTPQRRTVLEAFSGAADEHLSADEVHALARGALPEIGRGTVYAILAELAESGLLGSHGAPEPVRYEINVEPHGHFRCRLCARLFDVAPLRASRAGLAAEGFTVEAIAFVAEGTCAECNLFEQGVEDGVAELHTRDRVGADLLQTLSCRRLETPIGDLALAGSEEGVLRIAFPEHADFAAVVDRAGTRRGSRTARRHVDEAAEAIAGYLAGSGQSPETPFDAAVVPEAERRVLGSARGIHFGDSVSYVGLEDDGDPYLLGHALGSNPAPILVPCHRVRKGRGLPEAFVGGIERRERLLAVEAGGRA